MFCGNCGSQTSDRSVFRDQSRVRKEHVTPVNAQDDHPASPPVSLRLHSPQKTHVGLIVAIFTIVSVICMSGLIGVWALAEAAPAGPKSIYADYRGYADGETPSIGDFFWFTEDVKWDGLPAGRAAITDFGAITGYWKAYEETIPMYQGDGRYLMWLNAEISGSASQATITYHAGNAIALDEETGSDVDLSAWEGSSYNGRFDSGKFVAGDVTTMGIEIIIKDFYTLDGKQYAVGEENWISGEKSYFVLVRP